MLDMSSVEMNEEKLSEEDLSTTQQDDYADYHEYEPKIEGGFRGCLVVAGGFLGFFSTLGLLNTFGAFQLYYQGVLLPSYPPSVISWIGSLQLFLVFISGFIIGPLYDSYGARAITIPGSLIYVLSIMFTSLASKYYQFVLAQGIMFGIGAATIYYPSISTASQWFDKHRGLAIGVVVSGASLGGICWPLVFGRLLNTVGFPWTVRVFGFIFLALLTPACWLLVEKKDRVSGHQSAPSPPSPKPSVIAIFKDAKYTVFSVGMFFLQWGMFIPLFYMPTYGQHHGMTEDQANNLASYLNAGSLVSSIVVGYLADNLGRFNALFSCAISCSILLYCLYAIKSYGAIIAFSVLYGFCFGGLLSLPLACVAQITPDSRIIGAKIGIVMSICSFGNLTGSPIAGALMTKYQGEFGGLIDFSATVLLGGAILMLCSRVLASKQWIF